MIQSPKRVSGSETSDEMLSDELLVVYTIEYSLDEGDNPIQVLGVAMVALISALPDDRLWNKPVIYKGDNTGQIYIEGMKKKVWEDSKLG